MLAVGHKTDDRHRDAEPEQQQANMRGAVPAPNENPRMPCRSLDAHNANSAMATIASPPTKSCGPRIHFGMMYLTGP